MLQHVGVLVLHPDKPDANVHERFDSVKANRPGSKTVQEGLEQHSIADSVGENTWRNAEMHAFPGAQLAKETLCCGLRRDLNVIGDMIMRRPQNP